MNTTVTMKTFPNDCTRLDTPRQKWMRKSDGLSRFESLAWVLVPTGGTEVIEGSTVKLKPVLEATLQIPCLPVKSTAWKWLQDRQPPTKILPPLLLARPTVLLALKAVGAHHQPLSNRETAILLRTRHLRDVPPQEPLNPNNLN